MPTKRSPISAPLSDDEFDALADLLDEHSAFDIDGLLGILHAVAVAPSLLPPSAWIPVVLPNGFSGVDAAGAQEFIGLVMRLSNEVLAGLNDCQPMMPEADDVPGCESFAAGFVAGAELDPEWIGDADRWTFASWAGYLGGRPDVVPSATRAKSRNTSTRRSQRSAATWARSSSPRTSRSSRSVEPRSARHQRRRCFEPVASGGTSRAPAGRARSTSAVASTRGRRRRIEVRSLTTLRPLPRKSATAGREHRAAGHAEIRTLDVHLGNRG